MKVVLITGGARGIGAATASELARRGWTPVLADIDAGGDVLPLDVTDRDACEQVVATVMERHGRLDAVWANAGIASFGPLALTDPAAWERTIEVNLLGVYHTCRRVLPEMIARRWGRIVNVVSPIGFGGNAGQTAYAASKAGVVALTRSLALECGRRGVTANAVSPGFMDSALVAELSDDVRAGLIARTAIRRPIEPEEVAAAIRFAVADPALTGAVIPVDGGLT
jgi:3-oxoacyl-[acyl-carrier protein] reductase